MLMLLPSEKQPIELRIEFLIVAMCKKYEAKNMASIIITMYIIEENLCGE